MIILLIIWFAKQSFLTGIKMKTIVWDVDDVLNDLMKEWFGRFRLDHPSCLVSFEDLIENPPHHILGIAFDDYINSLDNFRSQYFMSLTPNPEILNWFRKYGILYRHIALTAAPLATANESSRWVMKHFGVWIRTFHFLPSLRSGENLPIYDQSKIDFLKWLNKGDVIIDDNINNLRGSRDASLNTILWPRPWNSSRQSISEILCYLNGI
jgi:5'(3')-deoxyribonucleotidase